MLSSTPVTRPVASIVAYCGESLDQIPPGTALASCVVDPMHTKGVPVIAAMAGTSFTVIVNVATPEQLPEATVYDMTEVPEA